MPAFPDCFPENFEKEILPADAIFQNLKVYRVLNKGILNREAFVSSYEENPNRFKKRGKENPATYSTSCFENFDEAKNILEMTLRPRHPQAALAKGITECSCGPCRQSDRTSHVDWWIYKDAYPENYFKEVQQ